MIPLLLSSALATPQLPTLPSGRYALELRVATLADAPWFPTLRGGSTSHVLVDITGGEGDTALRSRVCRVDIDGGKIARIEVPAAFLAAQVPRSVPAELGAGWLRVDLGLDVGGYAGTGPLPTDLDTTTDWDGDGKPAATILVHIPALGTAEMYVVQAAQLVLSGAIDGGGAAGTVEVVRFEQATLGARPGWMAAKTQVRVDPKRSGFTLLPIDPDGTCADVLTRNGS